MAAIAGLARAAAAEITIADARPDVPALASRAVDIADWDRVVSCFDTVCQEQLVAFSASRWPNVMLEPRLFEHNGRIVGGALVMVQGLPLKLTGLAICKWGPMLANSRSPQAATLYSGMVAALMTEFADRRGMMLSIMPHVSPDAINADYRVLRQLGFQRGFPLPHPSRYLVKLRLDDAALRKSFHQTWRRQLGKAEKSGLSFEHVGPDQFDEFRRLYAAMTDRKQFDDTSAFDTIDNLMALDEPLRPEIFYVRHEGEVIAGALIFKASDRAVYLYGATDDRALPLRAGYFLHWHIIRWLRDHTKAEWYDLGGTDGYQGLRQFKKGMVGEEGVVRPVPPVVNYASHFRARVIGTAAFTAREYLNRLKRHMAMQRPGWTKPDFAPEVMEDQFR